MAGRTAARSRAAVPAARKGLAAESARLAAELREERERQQALAEILQAVNAAPDDLKPVLDTILDKATRLCDAPCGIFWVYDGDVFRPGAMHGLPEAFAEYLQQTNERPTLSLGAIRGVAPFVHDVDLAGGDTYWSRSTPLNTAVIELGRARTSIGLDPSFTVLDRADSEDRLNLVRNDLGLAKKEARFPRKQTCSPSILTR